MKTKIKILATLVTLFLLWTKVMAKTNPVSDDFSLITPGNQVVNLSENALLSVELLDKAKSPVSGHAVKLISSLGEDEIKNLSKDGLSDQSGEVKFAVKSNKAGVVSYAAFDLTENILLKSRAKVVYFNSKNEILKASYASFGNSAGPVDHLKFEEVPDQMFVNDDFDLKITAYDANEQLVTNYNGKIKFSVEGANAKFADLPEDYQFTTQDQGSHLFSLAFSFSQEGFYTLKAMDLSNPGVFAEEKIIVIEDGVVNVPDDTEDSGAIKLTAPVSGNYSSNVQVISGQASAGAKLKIFDNSSEIGSVVVDASGNFSYTTGLLAEGQHKIYVATLNEVGTILETSNVVELAIDTKASEISQVVIEPSGPVDPGSPVTVKIFVEEELTKAQIILKGNVYDLKKVSDGVYGIGISAPIEFGEYKLKFVLKDELGNETQSEVEKIIKVGPTLGEKPKLPKVTGLKLTPGDKRVILNWDLPPLGSGLIKNYQIYYGPLPNLLNESVDTFTSETTWFVPNLENGKEYYFAVVAKDAQGNTSSVYSEILAATPSPVVANMPSPEIKNGAGGSEALGEMKKDASNSGPEIFWLVFVSVLGGVFYTMLRKIPEQN